MTVGNCWVSMSFEDSNGNSVTQIPRGSSDHNNVITVTNGKRGLSTAVKVEVALPNSAPQSNPGRLEFEFSHATVKQQHKTAWYPEFRAVTASQPDSDRALLTCLATGPCNVTFQCSNGQMFDPFQGCYVSSGAPPFTEQVKVG